jgi:transcription initiation factor TFIID subunit 6
VYGFSGAPRDPARYARAAGHPGVLLREDPILATRAEAAAPLPPAPWDAGVAPHWLAVNGRQPATRENAAAPAAPHRAKRARAAAAEPAAVPAAAAAPAPAPAPAAAEPAAEAGVAEDGALVRAPLRHLVSKELHLYRERLATALGGPGGARAAPAAEERGALAGLRAGAGLQPLAPYLCLFVAEEVAARLGAPARLAAPLRAAAAMAANPALDLGPYLHHLAPAVLSCLLARRLGAPGAAAAEDPAWEVRELAAAAAAAICAAYPEAGAGVRRQLAAALADPRAAATTLFGAAAGVAALGPRAARALLLPHLAPALAALGDALGARGRGAEAAARRERALRARAALLAAAAEAAFGAGALDAAEAAAPARLPAPRRRGGELARVPLEDALAAARGGGGAGQSKQTTPRAGGGARAKGGKRARAPARKAPGAPAEGLALEEAFGEAAERAAEGEARAAAEAAAAFFRAAPPGLLRAAAVVEAPDAPPAPPGRRANALAEAWRLDFPAAALHRGLAELFGADLAPYARAGAFAAAAPFV